MKLLKNFECHSRANLPCKAGGNLKKFLWIPTFVGMTDDIQIIFQRSLNISFKSEPF